MTSILRRPLRIRSLSDGGGIWGTTSGEYQIWNYNFSFHSCDKFTRLDLVQFIVVEALLRTSQVSLDLGYRWRDLIQVELQRRTKQPRMLICRGYFVNKTRHPWISKFNNLLNFLFCLLKKCLSRVFKIKAINNLF